MYRSSELNLQPLFNVTQTLEGFCVSECVNVGHLRFLDQLRVVFYLGVHHSSEHWQPSVGGQTSIQ